MRASVPPCELAQINAPDAPDGLRGTQVSSVVNAVVAMMLIPIG